MVRILKGILNTIKGNIDVSDIQYQTYGLFGIFNYPAYYLIWVYIAPETYESLFLRSICFILCLILTFHKYWPTIAKKHRLIYWHFTLAFTLPFFFTFMLIMNQGSDMWVTNNVIAFLFLLFLVDWVIALLLFIIGAVSACITASFFVTEFFPPSFNYIAFTITYFAIIMIGVLFSHNRKMIEEIRRTSIQAEANSRAKSEFIANMSHDIRTPITGILGMADSILLATKDSLQSSTTSPSEKDTLNQLDKTIDYNVHMLKDATYELLSLCNEILEVVQLESGKLSQKQDTFCIDALMEHIKKLLQPIAKQKGLDFSLHVNADVPQYVYGLHHYLTRIMLNLVSNALKFTEKGFVKVTASIASLEPNNPQGISKSIDQTSVPVRIKFDIEDSGIGIPEDKHDEIFSNFSRLTSSYDGKFKGFGLGLYTVREYIKAMDGDIYLESQLNQGSCFSVEIPFTTASDAEETVDFSSEDKIQTTTDHASAKKTTEPDPVSDQGLHRGKILIVEDNTLAMVGLRAQLKPYHYDIDHAENGYRAIELVNQHTYDIVFMDIGLPGINGIATTEKIRESHSSKHLPIIAITGHADNSEHTQACLDAGMQAVFNKPAQAETIRQIMSYYLNATPNK